MRITARDEARPSTVHGVAARTRGPLSIVESPVPRRIDGPAHAPDATNTRQTFSTIDRTRAAIDRSEPACNRERESGSLFVTTAVGVRCRAIRHGGFDPCPACGFAPDRGRPRRSRP
jgi:hypothetical protein